MWSMAQRNMKNNFEDSIPIDDDCLKLSDIAPLYYQAIDWRVGYRKWGNCAINYVRPVLPYTLMISLWSARLLH